MKACIGHFAICLKCEILIIDTLNDSIKKSNGIYNIHDPMGIKYLTQSRLGLSHLNAYKFRHNFQDCLNPLCPCSLEVESTIHYFLHYHYYNDICKALLDTVKKITNITVSNLSDEYLVNLMYGNPS